MLIFFLVDVCNTPALAITHMSETDIILSQMNRHTLNGILDCIRTVFSYNQAAGQQIYKKIIVVFTLFIGMA